MSRNNIEQVKKINREWLAELESEGGFHGILMNEPFTDNYWKEKYKIVFCNLETYGQPERENKVLDIDLFQEWLKNKSKTIRNTAMFLHCLCSTLDGNIFDKDRLSLAKKDDELLLETMKKVTYMNLLKDTNTGGRKFDEKYFWKFFKNDKDREHTKELITALSPDICIVTSAGRDLIEQLFVKKFDEKHLFSHDNTLFAALGHPSSWPQPEDYTLYNVNIIKKGLQTHGLAK